MNIALIKKIFINVSSIAKKKKVAAQFLKSGTFPLEGGLWVIGSEFSRKSAVKQLPPPLDTVKQWGGWRKNDILKYAVNCVEILTYPWFAWVPFDGKVDVRADVLLINRLMEPVGFDLKKRLVIRIHSTLNQNFLKQVYTSISGIYPCLESSYDSEIGYAVEELISGRSFTSSSDINRLKTFDLLISGLSKAPEVAKNEKACLDWLFMARGLIARLPVSLRSNVEAEVICICNRAKFSWVHGDLFGENIIISDEKTMVIDYDKAGIAPSFTDIMTLVVFEARSLNLDLADRFFSGKYNDDFKKMGVLIDKRKQVTVGIAIFIAWLGWKQTTEEFSEVNVARFFEILSRYLKGFENDINNGVRE